MDLQVYAQDRFIVNWADIEYIEIIFLKLHWPMRCFHGNRQQF